MERSCSWKTSFWINTAALTVRLSNRMGQKKRGSGKVDRCPVSFLLRCGCAARRSIYSAISFFIWPQLVLSTAVGRALPSDHSRDDSLITLPASALPPRSEPDLLRRGPRSVRVLRRASRVAICSSVSRAVNAALCSSLRALCASLKGRSNFSLRRAAPG